MRSADFFHFTSKPRCFLNTTYKPTTTKKNTGREGTAASIYRQRRALVSNSCSLPCYESYTKAGYALPQAHSPDVTFALGTECRRSHSFTRVHRPLPPRLTHSDRHPPHPTDAAPPGRAPSTGQHFSGGCQLPTVESDKLKRTLEAKTPPRSSPAVDASPMTTPVTTPRLPQPPPPPRSSNARIAGVVALYFVVSIAMVFVNKALVSSGASIPAPLFVTWFQCLTTIVICVALGKLSSARWAQGGVARAWGRSAFCSFAAEPNTMAGAAPVLLRGCTARTAPRNAYVSTAHIVVAEWGRVSCTREPAERTGQPQCGHFVFRSRWWHTFTVTVVSAGRWLTVVSLFVIVYCHGNGMVIVRAARRASSPACSCDGLELCWGYSVSGVCVCHFTAADTSGWPCRPPPPSSWSMCYLLGSGSPIPGQYPPYEYKPAIAARVAHLSVIFVGMVAFNNLCLQYVEVSFYNVARSLTIVFNVVLSYLVLGENTSLAVVGTLAVVIAGFLVRECV